MTTCRLCGVSLPPPATVCVACLRDKAAACPVCLNANGRLLAKYRRHWPDGTQFDDRGEPLKCGICGTHHAGWFQLACLRCQGRRYVLDSMAAWTKGVSP